jgi:hypothetical protein
MRLNAYDSLLRHYTKYCVRKKLHLSRICNHSLD